VGRPERHDVDYFPFYAKDGRTLFILESKYQCKGTGFFTNLLRFLSLQPDHYFSITDESDRLYFFSKTKCDQESGEDMLNIMVKTGKIDRELFECGIIASSDFLSSIEDAYKRRSNDCITIDEIKVIADINGVNDNINGVNVGINAAVSDLAGITSYENPQTKVKYSKRNKNLSALKNAVDEKLDYLITKKKRKLNGQRYQSFVLFWDAFGYKKGKAEAADAWLDIPQLTNSLVDKIILAAKTEAQNRPGLISENKTPKMAQGWLSGRRWEDEPYAPPEPQKVYVT